MLVLAPDSSRKISLAGSKPPAACARAGAPERCQAVLFTGVERLFLYVSSSFPRHVIACKEHFSPTPPAVLSGSDVFRANNARSWLR